MNFKFSKIIGCKLERQEDLPFKFNGGSCGNYNLSGQDTLLLCFGWIDKRTCHK